MTVTVAYVSEMHLNPSSACFSEVGCIDICVISNIGLKGNFEKLINSLNMGRVKVTNYDSTLICQ